MRFQSLDPPIAFALVREVADLLLGLVLGNPVGVLEAARELVPPTGDLVELVVRQPAPLFADLALELLPVAFDPVPIHGVTLSWKVVCCVSECTARKRASPQLEGSD